MTLPRFIVPGQTVFLTRRCDDRMFLMRPDPEINQVLLYTLTVLANKHGLRVSHFVAMSNHWHAVVTDPRGVLPKFLQEFGKETALALKCVRAKRRGWWDANEKPAVQRLLTEQSIVSQIAYGYVNPTACGAVRLPHKWPGINLRPSQIGSSVTVQRPSFYFKNETKFPAQVTLQIQAPPCFEGRESWLRGAVHNAVEQAVAVAHQRLRAADKRFLGAAAVLATDPYSRPTTHHGAQAFIPALAARCRETLHEGIAQLRAFHTAYRTAYRAWSAGQHEVEFPFGSWAIVQLHHACCAHA